MKVSVNNGPFEFQLQGKVYSFKPQGRAHRFGNPGIVRWSDKPPAAARFFVGLSVCNDPKYTVDDLADYVKRIRGNQKNDAGTRIDPDASFGIQKGLCRHKPMFHGDKDCGLVYENSVQFMILSISGESDDLFRGNMIRLGELIARDFKQQSVILEFQRKGVATDVMSLGWVGR